MRKRLGGSGGDRRWLTVVGIVLLTAVAGARLASAQEPKGRIQRLTEEGAQPRTGTFSLLPWESIDMLSGNGVLTWTDLAVPGAGGFDLRIQRTLNLNTMQWRITVPGPQTVVLSIPGPGMSTAVPNPVIESADGGREYTFKESEDVYVTHSYARLLTGGADTRLELPNGLVYHFAQRQAGSQFYERTAITDPFGNAILFSRAGTTEYITLQIRNQAAREVTIDRPEGSGQMTMVHEGRTWTYTQTGSLYTAALPEGLTWTARTEGLGAQAGAESGYRVTVTTPHGGWVAYSVLRFATTTGGGGQVLKWRDAGGRDVPPGRWTFEHFQGGYPDVVSQVLGPDAIVHRYQHSGCSAGDAWTTRVVLASHSVFAGSLGVTGTISLQGDPVQTTGYSWTCAAPDLPAGVGGDLAITNDGQSVHVEDARPIWPLGTTVIRDGAAFSRNWTYSSTAPNEYGFPVRLTETGPGRSRTADYTYEHRRTGTPHLLGLLKSETITATGESAVVSSWSYDPNGFLTTRTIRGVTTTFTATDAGDVQEEKDAHNHATTFAYRYGVPSQITTPGYSITRKISPRSTIEWEARRGATTRFEYDDLGRETLRTPQLGRPTGTDYDMADGAWVSTTATRGVAFTRTYLDGYGRSVGTENAVGVTTVVEYDAWGRKVFESDPCDAAPCHGTRTTYDRIDRVTETRRVARAVDGSETVVLGPEAGRTRYTYGAEANALKVSITEQVRDAQTPGGEKLRTSYQYWRGIGAPEATRLEQVTDATGATTSYAYNLVGQLRTVTPPVGGGRSWSYNSQGLLESEQHPESGETRYGYDASGVLQWKVEAFGSAHERKTAYQYDGNHRLTGVVLGSDNPALPAAVTFAYDASDNRWRTTNATATIETTFDAANRATRQTLTFATPGAGPFATDYAYDSYDRPIQVAYPSGRVVNYVYDAGHRVSRVWSPGATGDIANSFVYAPSGAVRSYRLANGVEHHAVYDGRQRPVSIQATGGALSLGYDYDNVGNVQHIGDARAGYGQAFGYDDLDRLTSAQGPWGALTFGYDAVGNRQTRTDTRGTQTYTMNGAGRLDVSGPGGTTLFTHNSRGELTDDQSGSYTYTATGMLETATRAGQTITHAYDADNRRLSLQVGGAERRLYVPDLSGQVLAEYRHAGGTTVLARDHVYGAGRLLSTVESCTSGVDGVGWYAQFWDNPTRSGAPKYTVNYPAGTLDQDWGLGSPSAACGIPADGFSARFKRTLLDVPAGSYEFELDADDEATLTVGDFSKPSMKGPVTLDVPLNGNHTVVVTFKDENGKARVEACWSGDGCTTPTGPWTVEYFANTNLFGSPALPARQEALGSSARAMLEHDWGSSTPCDGRSPCSIEADNFSARWTYGSPLQEGRYVFHFSSDDGLRVYLKDMQTGGIRYVLNAFGSPRSGDFPDSEGIDVNGHEVPVVEYVEYTGSAYVQVGWTPVPSCFDTGIPPGNWTGTYWASGNLQSVMVRNHGADRLEVNWDAARPGAGCLPSGGAYLVRFESTRLFDGGTYRFHLAAAGAVNVMLNGEETLFNDPSEHAAVEVTFDAVIPPGTNQLQVDYTETTGPASLKVWWERLSSEAPRTVSGSILLDLNVNGVFDEGEFYLTEPGFAACEEMGSSVFVEGLRVSWRNLATGLSGLARATTCGPQSPPYYAEQLTPGSYAMSLKRVETVEGPVLDLPGAWRVLGGEATITVENEAVAHNFRVYRCEPWPPVPGTAWKGEYFDNPTLTGSPVWVAHEGEGFLRPQWTASPPPLACGVPVDDFSARFTRRVTLPAGGYVFKARSDDGVRVKLRSAGTDEWRTIVDAWGIHGADTFESEVIPLVAGEYDLTVEYYEHLEAAVLDVWWETPCDATVPADRWQGEYFDNRTLTGPPVLTRDDGDGALSFAWGEGSPGSGCDVPADSFSVRWTRTVTLEPGNYTIHLTSDDGVKLYVDGVLKRNDWNDHGPVSVSVPLTFTEEDSQEHLIVVEYYDHAGGATFELWWTEAAPEPMTVASAQSTSATPSGPGSPPAVAARAAPAGAWLALLLALLTSVWASRWRPARRLVARVVVWMTIGLGLVAVIPASAQVVSEPTANVGRFDVAFSPVAQRSLLVWETWQGQVKGLVLNAAGAPVGTAVTIGATSASAPRVTASVTGPTFLVTFTQGSDRVAAVVTVPATGAATVGPICWVGPLQWVAWNEGGTAALADGTWLATWWNGSTSVHVTRLAATGEMQGTPVVVVTDPAVPVAPAIACHATGCLVVGRTWSEAVWGRWLDLTGTPQGTAFTVEAGAGRRTAPAVSYSATEERYLVTWAREEVPQRTTIVPGASTPGTIGPVVSARVGRTTAVAGLASGNVALVVAQGNSAEVWAQEVTGAGTVVGTPRTVSAVETTDGQPVVTGNPTAGTWLVAYRPNAQTLRVEVVSVTTTAAPLRKQAPMWAATGQPLEIPARWTSPYTDVAYSICWDTTDNGVCDGGWRPAGGATIGSLFGLTAGTRYYWQVRVQTASGVVHADNGAWWPVTVSATGVGLAKQTPANGVTGQATTIPAQWTSPYTNVAYLICWDTTDNNACGGSWRPAGGSTTAELFNLVPGVTYYWQVKAEVTPGQFVEADNGQWRSFTVGTASSYLLTVTKAGSGTGTVSASSGALNCGATCAASYAAGTVVTLTASAASGSTFAGWSGDADCADGVVTLSGARNCTATFTTAATVSLTVSKAGTGAGTVTASTGALSCGATCAASYPVNTAVTLTAEPASGSTFAGWSGDAGCAAAMTLATSRTCVATFTAIPSVTLSVTKSGDGTGTVTAGTGSLSCGATCAASYPARAPVVLTAIPASGSTFVGWTGCVTTTVAQITITPTAAVTCGAAFAVPAPPPDAPPGGASIVGDDTPPSRADTAPPGAWEYVHADALGSVRAVTDEGGAVVRRHEYLPFGEEWHGPTGAPTVRFTSKEYDDETGLYYFGARYLRADLGRFTTIDPVHTWSENLVDPQRWNRYSYVRNNPLKYTDPDGRCVYPGADCGQFLLGAAKAVANIVPDSISLLNAATNLVIAPATDFRFSALPRFEAANEDQRRGMFSANFMMLAAPVAELAGAETAAAGGTELVQRAMSRAELSATEATGLVRGGRPGTHYASDAVNSGAHRAQQRLALPQAPQIRVTLEVPTGAFSNSTKVPPAYGMSGGGLQRTASGKIPAVVRKVEEMK